MVKALRRDVPKEERSLANAYEPSRFPMVETPRNISTMKDAFKKKSEVHDCLNGSCFALLMMLLPNFFGRDID